MWETQPGTSSTESPPPTADKRASLGPNMPHDCHVCIQAHVDSQCQPPANRRAALEPDMPHDCHVYMQKPMPTANRRVMLGLNMPHEYDCHICKSMYHQPTNALDYPTCPHDCHVHMPVHINSQCQLPVSHPSKVEASKGPSSRCRVAFIPISSSATSPYQHM